MGYRKHHTARAVKSGFAKLTLSKLRRSGFHFWAIHLTWLSLPDLWQQARDLKTDVAVLEKMELGMNYHAAMGAVLCEGADHK
eukprot:10663585-Karenia_brevis.AAC.1